MSGWGIAETAPVIEKIKAESADYLRGLNSCGEITWSVYDKAFDFYMELISRAYEQGKKDAQPYTDADIQKMQDLEQTQFEKMYQLGYEEGKKAAQPEQRWIPCSERLPEDLEEVNVTWVNHDPEPYYNFVKDKPFTATAVYYKEKWYWYSSTCTDLLAEYGRNPNQEIDDDIEIVAWMPLPEPYEGR